jgi:hypothetical protein
VSAQIGSAAIALLAPDWSAPPEFIAEDKAEVQHGREDSGKNAQHHGESPATSGANQRNGRGGYNSQHGSNMSHLTCWKMSGGESAQNQT